MVEALDGLKYGSLIFAIILIAAMLIVPWFTKDKKLTILLIVLTIACMYIMWCVVYMSQMFIVDITQPIKE
ncbi:v-type proton atpase subunit [Anaeramoeba ignava]|uniref:V-type proton atpase subunit n=1 Tax=Anaeramoeba ignava TaxID=1746090 RepID=A0A9Q0LKM0_ANAIG|nr:v-type proton atpase subunit [Anaeramoeba ignava]